MLFLSPPSAGPGEKGRKCEKRRTNVARPKPLTASPGMNRAGLLEIWRTGQEGQDETERREGQCREVIERRVLGAGGWYSCYKKQEKLLGGASQPSTCRAKSCPM